MTKLEQAARQALEALAESHDDVIDCLNVATNMGSTRLQEIYENQLNKHEKAVTALREALAEQALQKLSDFHQSIEEPTCNQHPDAPHGFDRNASHGAGRYVCECEGWEPEPAEQEHDGHWSDCSVHNEPAYPNGPCDCGGYPPKHWRCACGANLYIDSNGAPASKAEQTDQKPVAFRTMEVRMEPVACGCGATAYCLIRHTNLPEHNFTPICLSCLQEHEQNAQEVNEHEMNNFGGAYGLVTWETKPLYAAPVRTKDLTDDEIDAIEIITDRQFARAVIAADREKNK